MRPETIWVFVGASDLFLGNTDISAENILAREDVWRRSGAMLGMSDCLLPVCSSIEFVRIIG